MTQQANPNHVAIEKRSWLRDLWDRSKTKMFNTGVVGAAVYYAATHDTHDISVAGLYGLGTALMCLLLAPIIAPIYSNLTTPKDGDQSNHVYKTEGKIVYTACLCGFISAALMTAPLWNHPSASRKQAASSAANSEIINAAKDVCEKQKLNDAPYEFLIEPDAGICGSGKNRNARVSLGILDTYDDTVLVEVNVMNACKKKAHRIIAFRKEFSGKCTPLSESPSRGG